MLDKVSLLIIHFAITFIEEYLKLRIFSRNLNFYNEQTQPAFHVISLNISRYAVGRF